MFLFNEDFWITAEVSVLIDSLVAFRLYIAAIFFLTYKLALTIMLSITSILRISINNKDSYFAHCKSPATEMVR